ncbi:uncharacterized protein LOC143058757 [Mytilus galloprovincialis]|uniref:uncharacterized protein LOC143058757 n=1 Tax=Mytilus galloprovincialis TaxID=29158 RepID=UPI003F7BAA18
MVLSCCVINCTSRFGQYSFYRVPKKPLEKRKLWVEAIKREGENGSVWEPSDYERVCSRHFITGQKSNDQENPDYVPSLHMGTIDMHTDGPQRFARYERYQKRDDDRKTAAVALQELSLNVPPTPEKPSVHDNCIKTIASLRLENQQLYTELNRLQVENTHLKTELLNLKFEDSAVATDSKTTFYTGIPSKALFMWVLSFCTTVLPSSRVVSPKGVLLCLLIKLRLNLHLEDIAFRLNISKTTVSDILNQGLPALAKKLNFLVQWPDKDSLIKNMPVIFKKTYPRCVSIIDCFEVFINRPGHLTARAQTWSNYKHHNTIKFLVSITPTGAISYVSRAFGGRTSDKVITQRSGYLDKLEHSDQVLADRGFLISEELASHGATLIIPAFTRGKSQLSAKEIELTRQIAHVRIHVERAIERVKNFNILSTNMNLHLVPHSDSIVTICSCICNLQPALVS